LKKQKNAPQILTREEWPYEVPENWVWTRLLSGGAECLDKYRQPVNAAERKNREGNIPYYGATGQVGWIDTYLTDEQLVLLGEDGAPFLDAEKNKAYIIEGPAWVNNHAHILRSLYGNIGNLFLLHYLNQFDYVNYVSGTTRLKLTQAKMNEMPFPLPPLPEQQRIVARIESLFSKLDAAAEKIRATIDTFPTRKTALLHKAFTGELTKKWREEHGVGMDGWKEQTLQDVCSMKITDGTHQTPTYCTAEEGIPFISSKDVTQGYIDWRHIKYIVPSLHEELYKRLAPQKDDVLLAKNGTTGIAAIVDVDKVFDIYVTLAVLRPNKEQIIPSYLLHIVNSPACKQQFDEHLTGIGLPNLHLRDIKAVLITVPTLPEQKEVVRILDAIFKCEQKAKEVAERLLEKIALTKKAILARAFRGLLGTNDPKEESAEGLLKYSYHKEVS